MTKEIKAPATQSAAEFAAVQLALKGLWVKASGGCPNRLEREPVALCSENEMRPCIFELSKELRKNGCESFTAVIHEWQEHYHVERYVPDYYKEQPKIREGRVV